MLENQVYKIYVPNFKKISPFLAVIIALYSQKGITPILWLTIYGRSTLRRKLPRIACCVLPHNLSCVVEICISGSAFEFALICLPRFMFCPWKTLRRSVHLWRHISVTWPDPVIFLSKVALQRISHKFCKILALSSQRFGGHCRKLMGRRGITPPPCATGVNVNVEKYWFLVTKKPIMFKRHVFRLTGHKLGSFERFVRLFLVSLFISIRCHCRT